MKRWRWWRDRGHGGGLLGRLRWPGWVGVLMVAWGGDAAVDPTGQPRVEAGDLAYLGAFALPVEDLGGSRFGYGGRGVAPYRDPGTGRMTLFIEGHAWQPGQVAQVEVPEELGAGGDWEALPVATVRQPFADVTDGRMESLGGDGFVYGMLVHEGRLVVGASIYYDGGCVQVNTHGVSGLELGVPDDFRGLFPMVAVANPRALGGYMTPIPEDWRERFGGPALTGNAGLPIIGCGSAGPAATVFDPAAVGETGSIAGVTVLFYPLSHPLAPETTQNPLFNLATHLVGMAFPAGSRSVLFVGRQGTGPYCYGTGGETGGECYDPADASHGTHAYPYRHQVWAYDANRLVEVREGRRQPWDVEPYAVWSLEEMDSGGAADLVGAGYDPEEGRWYLTQAYEERPRVDVYEVRAAVAPAILGVSRTRESIEIRFGTVAGRVYRLEQCDEVAAGRWQPVGADLTGTGGLVEVAEPMSGMRRFYRVATLR